MCSQNVIFEKVVGNKKQIFILFQFLENREHNISNIKLPTYNSHIKFVKNHPYRAWFLIKSKEIYIGSIYVMDSNCISIFLIDYSLCLSQIIEKICKKYKPLKEIKSVRPANFYINIATNNTKFESQMNKIGAIKIQSTYSLNFKKNNN